MNTNQRKMFKVGLVISLASMFFILSACTSLPQKQGSNAEDGKAGSTTPLSKPGTDKNPANAEKPNEIKPSQKENTLADNANKTSKEEKTKKQTNKTDDKKIKTTKKKCQIVKNNLNGEKFIVEVIDKLETIKKLDKSWRPSDCNAIQSARKNNRTYRVEFSKEKVIIKHKSKKKGNMKELASLNWEKDITPKFLVVLRSAFKMAQNKIDKSRSKTDTLSIFEWSFPKGQVKNAKVIPGTEKMKAGGHSGRSYTTIHGGNVYWTTKKPFKLVNKPADLIVYEPYKKEKLAALAQLFSMN